MKNAKAFFRTSSLLDTLFPKAIAADDPASSPTSLALSCYLGEKDLKKWFDHNKDKPVHHSVYSHQHIHMWVESHPDFDPTKGPPLPPEVVQVLLDVSSTFGTVFDADKCVQ